MGEKVPYRIFLREEVVEALKKAAETQTDEMTHNQIAAEIITRCLPIWIQARKSFDDTVDDFDKYFRQVTAEAKARQKPK
jgi:hypothetical protein